MRDTVIFCHSEHHGNTLRLVSALAEKYGAEVAGVPGADATDVSEYKAVGFASGIYFSKFHSSLFSLAECLRGLSGKKCFLLFTAGMPNPRNADSFAKKLKALGAEVAGVYGCRGWDTVGPLRLFGGIAKGRPSEKEVAGAIKFFEDKVLTRD